jgi:hypothetical protein
MGVAIGQAIGRAIANLLGTASGGSSGPAWDLNLVADWNAKLGLTFSGANITGWTDQKNGLILTPGFGNNTVSATGSANGTQVVQVLSGSALSANLNAHIPVGTTNRTVITLARLPTGASTGSGAPMWGTNVNNQAFGIAFNSFEFAACDYWGGSLASSVSYADSGWKIAAGFLDTQIIRVAVNATVSSPSATLSLNTATNIIRFGRDLAGNSRNAVNIARCLIYNAAISLDQYATIRAKLASEHGIS